MIPHLSLATPGFRSEFEFDSSRENWVVIMAFPALEFHPDDHLIYWNYNGNALPIPRSVQLNETECSAFRQTFSTLCRLHQSALPQNMLEAELTVLQILQRFLQVPDQADDAVELFRRRLAEDTRWQYSIKKFPVLLKNACASLEKLILYLRKNSLAINTKKKIPIKTLE